MSPPTWVSISPIPLIWVSTFPVLLIFEVAVSADNIRDWLAMFGAGRVRNGLTTPALRYRLLSTKKKTPNAMRHMLMRCRNRLSQNLGRPYRTSAKLPAG
jgi:hypothetical protein